MNKKRPTALVILDGFGYSKKTRYNAIHNASTPHFDEWFRHYPHAILQAAGSAVGLLDGYVGNSEVGHLTIGAGRIIDQPVKIIHEAIKNGSFFRNKILRDNLYKLAQSGKTLHIMGLLSDAGVHSHIEQLFALLQAAHQLGIQHVVVHAFLDGRDTPPQSAMHYLKILDTELQKIGGILGSVHGRFYAMDRDHNWQRIEKSYRVLTEPQQIILSHWCNVLDHYYKNNITDEFIPPTQLNPDAFVKNGDGIIFFNVRSDRARELTESFVNQKFNNFKRYSINLAFFITPIAYNQDLTTTPLFETLQITHTLKEILAQHNKTIFSIAESEKYAHVTYFFNGGKEEKQVNEIWKLIPSIPAKSYVHIPKMAAPQITTSILKSLKTNPADFYLINYANADMIGHSGNFAATVKAIECLDHELSKLYDQIINQMDGTLYITADHGNAENTYDEASHQNRTAHTNNPVPFIMIRKKLRHSPELLPLSQLADIAPFILRNMDIPIPQQMLK